VKIFTRIVTAITAAVVSVFIATPAFAHEGEDAEKFNPLEEFSAAGEPVQMVPILITGAIVLFIVLITAQLLSGLFEKKSN